MTKCILTKGLLCRYNCVYTWAFVGIKCHKNKISHTLNRHHYSYRSFKCRPDLALHHCSLGLDRFRLWLYSVLAPFQLSLVQQCCKPQCEQGKLNIEPLQHAPISIRVRSNHVNYSFKRQLHRLLNPECRQSLQSIEWEGCVSDIGATQGLFLFLKNSASLLLIFAGSVSIQVSIYPRPI